jgi:hypothetical protein
MTVAQKDGGHSAGAHTTCGGDADASIGAGVTGFDTAVLQGFEQFGRAGDVAGGSHADGEIVFAFRRHREEVVEGRDTQDVTKRQSEFTRDVTEQLRRKVAVQSLRDMQDFDERVTRGIMSCDRAIKLLFPIVSGRERR